jgi:YHS domain-containing protein
MAVDPICGMSVDPAIAAGRHEYQGQTYYFCAVSCLARFRADPASALNKQPQSHATIPSTRKPLPMMMPVRQGEIDPVCGMTVQPATAAGLHQHQGKTYYFCAVSCLTKFKADPDYYLLNEFQNLCLFPQEGWSSMSARWILRFLNPNRALAEFAAWRLNPRSYRPRRPAILSLMI